jgi:glutathione synthase/RimK-type ligase-like ATP-grasp enzyme
MRVLLSDGSGLTARQCATQLASVGHRVEVLSADPLALTRFTRHVRRLHRVPRYGDDPMAWFTAALRVVDAPSPSGPVDVLLPTQEQVAVLALRAGELRERRVALAVPTFVALARLQDKVSATRTLADVGIPQPHTVAAVHRAELLAFDRFPAYVKPPIGTATTGIVRVRNGEQLSAFAAGLDDTHFALGGLVIQHAVDGPLAMVQCVFDAGRLVAWHANFRVREGSRGGASNKRSVELPEVRAYCAALGAELQWHGALSLDVILTGGVSADVVVIDVNPRLVEPGNAWRSGTDLVAAMLDISIGRHPEFQAAGREQVATHQLLLAVLAAAACGRRAVLDEVLSAVRRTGGYRGSAEELTPISGDWRAAVPVAVAVMAGIIGPKAAHSLARGTVQNYALSPDGWRALLDEDARGH